MIVRDQLVGSQNVSRVAPRGGSTALLLFLVLLVSFVYFFPRWADWNENSHFALVQAVVEEHTFVIDDFYQQTGDYAIYRGHQYTDKAPGLSFVAVPIYAAFRVVAQKIPSGVWTRAAASNPAFAATLRPGGTGIEESKVEYAAGLYLVTIFAVSLPSALLWLLVYRFLGDIGVSRGIRLVVALACALGTVAFPYATVFYSHQTASFLVFSGFYLLFLIKRERVSPHYSWAVGAILGLAVLTDFPSLIPTALLLVYATSFRSLRAVPRIVGGALPFAIVLAFYNEVCFGSPFTSSYRYLALFPTQRDYGFLGFSLPTWQAFWGITFSPYRGLFFSSPFLLAALPGIWLAWRSRRWRAELLVSIGVMVAYLVLISSYYDWKGGFAVAGPRNLIPLIPFAALPLARGIDAAWHSGFWRPIVTAALAWSLVAMFVQTAGSQDFAPITVPNPLFEFFLPRLLDGDINRNLGMIPHLSRWYSLLPLLAAIGLVSVSFWLREGKTRDPRTE